MADRPLIVGIGGTLREESWSRVALKESLRVAEEKGAETELLDLRELDLPMYLPDLPPEGYPAAHRGAVSHLLASVRRAQALIWASPTYHGTVSGVFKNALDMLELLADESPSYLSGKAVGLIAVSDSQTFAAMASAAHELRAWLAPAQITLGEEDFDSSLRLKAGRPVRRVERLVGELLEFASMRLLASTL